MHWFESRKYILSYDLPIKIADFGLASIIEKRKIEVQEEVEMVCNSNGNESGTEDKKRNHVIYSAYHYI